MMKERIVGRLFTVMFTRFVIRVFFILDLCAGYVIFD